MTAPVSLAPVQALGAERLEIVGDAERLAAVTPAWMALWEEAGALIFQSPRWIEAWWRTVPDRQRRALRLALAWEGDRLIAVLPLATNRRRGLRMLEWAAKDHTDYGDALLAPGTDPAILGRVWDHVCAAGGFDFVYLNRLLPDAVARALLPPSGTSRLRPNHRSDISYRVAGSFPSGAAWLQGHSKKNRQNYRRGQKFIGDLGTLTFRLLPPDAPRAELLERLAELKRKWLQTTGNESDLYDRGSPALAALVDVLAEAGLLHIFVLECDGLVVAVSLNFVQRGTMMAFVTSYDPAFERGSPGMILMMDYIQWSIDNGLHTVDFLCGAEAFKRRFSTTGVRLDAVIGSRTLPGAMAVMADRAAQSLRGLRARYARTAERPGTAEAE